MHLEKFTANIYNMYLRLNKTSRPFYILYIVGDFNINLMKIQKMIESDSTLILL